MKKVSVGLLAIFVVLGGIFLYKADSVTALQGWFRPGPGLTRWKVVEAFVRDTGVALVNFPTAACTFTDVSSTETYYEEITTACENGWVSGYANGTFGPKNLITRSELAKEAYMVYAVPAYLPPAPSFPDIAGTWYEGYVESLNVLGAILPTQAGIFDGNSVARQPFLDQITNTL